MSSLPLRHPFGILRKTRPAGVAGLTAVLLFGTLAAPPASAQTSQDRIDRAREMVMPRRCRTTSDRDEIVICGARRDPDRYRLPFRGERTLESRYDRARGDLPRASLDAAPAPCGIFHGQRQCGRREMADNGYGGGRDPLTVGTRIVEQLVDPD